MKNKLITFTLIGSVLIGSASYGAGDQLLTKAKVDQTLRPTLISVVEEKSYEIDINGEKLILPVDIKEAFINDKGIIMIPLRAVAEALGYEVKWNGETRSVELMAGAQWTQITIGKDSYFFARMKARPLGQAPEIINDRTFVPIEFVEEILQAEVAITDNKIDIKNHLYESLPTLSYGFDVDLEGFKVLFADLPVDAEDDIYELHYEHKYIPVVDKESKGLFITGHNRSDDLFSYTYKKIGKEEGLKPNAQYEMNLSFTMATNVPSGMFGIGGSPGESIYVKAGIVNKEPLPVIDSSNYYRLDIDKGNQSNGGKDLAVLGNIAKTDGSMDDDFAYKNFETKAIIETDSEGNAFIVIGLDSGFEGKTEVYFDNIQVQFKALAE